MLRGAAGVSMTQGAWHRVSLLVVRALPRDIDDDLAVATATGEVAVVR